MERLQQLLAQLQDVDEKLDALLSHDDLTDAQRAEHQKLEAERVRILAAIKREQERQARDEERATLAADAERRGRTVAGTNRRADPDDPHAVVISTTGPGKITVKTPDFSKDPKKGFERERDFYMTVIQTSQSGRMDDRLRFLWQPTAAQQWPTQQLTVGSDEARGASDPYGGFMVPEAFSPDFLKVQPEDDPMGKRTTGIPMARPIVRIPARTDKDHRTSVAGGLTVTRRPETLGGTASQMTLEQVSLEAHSLFGLSYATEELLADSPISFAAILEAGFSDQFTYALVKERISGTGVGEFEGVLNASALITVNKRTGQAASTIILENILDMRSQCWGYRKAIWIANHDTIPQMGTLNQQVGTAGTGMIWLPSLREGEPDMLMGRPLVFSEYAKALGTAGDLILANWSEYLEGLYQPMQSAESIHVRFVNHERAFKWWLRNDGRSWWKTDLTPVNSAKHLSPFVVLQTRS